MLKKCVQKLHYIIKRMYKDKKGVIAFGVFLYIIWSVLKNLEKIPLAVLFDGGFYLIGAIVVLMVCVLLFCLKEANKIGAKY